MALPTESVQVKLTPSAGFCIKSVTTTSGFFNVSSSSSASSSSTSNSEDPSTTSSSSSTSAPNPNPNPNPNLLEPTSHIPNLPRPSNHTQIPKGVKVFLNVAWDRNVPPPPEVSEDVIRRAMAGADLDGDGDDVGVDNYGFVGGHGVNSGGHGVNSGGHGTVGGGTNGSDGDERGSRTYYVPVIVSEPKETTDKSGKPSIVFDCIFSSTLKGRCSKDKDFKLYIVELALEHVEQKVHLTLSREVGTPNIASKGKVEPRTVLIPRRLVDGREVGPQSSLVNGSSLENKNNKIEKKEKKKKEKEQGREQSTELDATTSTTPTSNLPRSILKSQSQTRSQFQSQTQTQKMENTPPPMPNSDNDNDNATSAGKKKPPLIEVLSSMSTEDKVVNGNGNGGGEVTSDKLLPETRTGIVALNMEEKSISGLGLPTPRWRWTKEGEGEGGRRLKIEIEVPNLTRNLHTQSTLDIEARRILLHIPEVYYLDINLDLPDAQIGKIGAVQVDDDPSREDVLDLDLEALRVKGHNAGEALRLKRQRDFDVEGAKAEWRINDRKLNIFV